jgi:predicted nucleic acid-binding protein
MMVLDTNVLSELMRRQPDVQVLAWLDQRSETEFFLSAVTVAEILQGIAKLPNGKRKLALRAAFEQMLAERFADRVLAFDKDAATRYAELVTSLERIGRPIGMADAQIAAICLSNHAALVTRNVKDFSSTGVVVFDPWAAG